MFDRELLRSSTGQMLWVVTSALTHLDTPRALQVSAPVSIVTPDSNALGFVLHFTPIQTVSITIRCTNLAPGSRHLVRKYLRDRGVSRTLEPENACCACAGIHEAQRWYSDIESLYPHELSMAPTLHFDILAEIIQYLPNDHALVYGSTCSFLRPLAVRHAVADVVFNSIAHLRMFCQFMLDDETRITSLRKLDMLSGIPASSRFYTCVGPLTQLLRHATNLEVLTLPAPDLLFDLEDGLRNVVTSLKELTSLSLTSFGSESQKMLLQLRSAPRLQRLVISERWTVHPNESRGSIILPPMASLRTLVLDGVRSPPLLYTLPRLAPALRSLQVTNVSFWLEDLGQAERPWWNSLERIRGDLHATWSVRIPHPVNALQVDSTLDPQRDWDPAPMFEMLMAASPKRLSMGMHARFNQPLWRTYAPAMPRLRYMELIVIDSDPSSPDLEFWITNMSQTGPCDLFALAIYIQRPSQDPVDCPSIPSAGPIDTQLSFRLQAALTRSLPSLRLLALSIGPHPAAREGHDLDMYSVFGGSEFNWWVSGPPPGSSEDPPLLSTHHAADTANTVMDYGLLRTWRRVEEKKGVHLFPALRDTDLDKLVDQRTFLAAYT